MIKSLLLLALVLFNSAALAEERLDKPLTIATYLNVNFFSGKFKNAEKRHFTEDIVLEMFKRAGLPLPTIKDYNITRSLAMTKSGSVDAVFPVMKSEERSEYLTYLSRPIEITNLYLFTLKSRGINEYEGDLNSLKGLKLGYIDIGHYGTIGKYLRVEHGNTLNIPSIDSMPRVLANNLVDGFIITDYEGLAAIKKQKLESQIKMHNMPLGVLRSTLAFSKNKNFNPELIEKLNAALQTMKDDGSFDKLSK